MSDVRLRIAGGLTDVWNYFDELRSRGVSRVKLMRDARVERGTKG